MRIYHLGQQRVHCNHLMHLDPTLRLRAMGVDVFLSVARPYFAASSLILSPPFATGMTQIGVATSAELRNDI
jgi:hypothetical protein